MFKVLPLTLFLVFVLHNPQAAYADIRGFAVFDVRKTLPLSDDEPVYYDYYINLGSDHGARIGSLITVFRRVPVVDNYRSTAHPDLIVPVAKLKVILAQKDLAVARLVDQQSRKFTPVLQFEKIMVGDRVELGGGPGVESGTDNRGTESGDKTGTELQKDNTPSEIGSAEPQPLKLPEPEVAKPSAPNQESTTAVDSGAEGRQPAHQKSVLRAGQPTAQLESPQQKVVPKTSL